MREGTFVNSESNSDLGHKLVTGQVSRHHGPPIRDERVPLRGAALAFL